MELKDDGMLKVYLSVEVNQYIDYLFLHQSTYAKKIEQRFNVLPGRIATPVLPGHNLGGADLQPAVMPLSELQSKLGSLRYAIDHTRPDLAFSGSISASDVSGRNIDSALKYLCSTSNKGICYRRGPTGL